MYEYVNRYLPIVCIGINPLLLFVGVIVAYPTVMLVMRVALLPS